MKRQANALTAVLENWQDVENAIDIYANSAGSALRENEIYLDSWEAKSKAVSAAWNELVNSLLDSNWIKGFLDGAQNVLSWLTNTNALIPVLAGLIGGVLTLAIQGLVKWIQGLKVALTEVNLLAGGIPLLIGLITTLAVGVVTWGINASDTAKQIENLTNKIEEQQKAIDDLNAKEKEATDLYKEYASLMSKSNAYGLSTEEKENLLKISNDLVDTYGLEVEGIDAVTGAYIIGANAINDYVEALRQERIEKQKDQTDARNERIKKNLSPIPEDKYRLKTLQDAKSNYHKFSDIIDEYQKLSKEEQNSFGLLGKLTNKAFDLGLDGAIGQELYDYIIGTQDLDTEISKLQNKINSKINSVIKDVITNIQVENADTITQTGESLLTSMLQSILPNIENLDEEKIKQIQDDVNTFADTYGHVFDDLGLKNQQIQEKINSNTVGIQDYKDLLDNQMKQLQVIEQIFGATSEEANAFRGQLNKSIENNTGLYFANISKTMSESDLDTSEFDKVTSAILKLDGAMANGEITFSEYVDELNKNLDNISLESTFQGDENAAKSFFAVLNDKGKKAIQNLMAQYQNGEISQKDYLSGIADMVDYFENLSNQATLMLGVDSSELSETIDGLKEAQNELNNFKSVIQTIPDTFEEFKNGGVASVGALTSALEKAGITSMEIGGKVRNTSKEIAQAMQENAENFAEAKEKIADDFRKNLTTIGKNLAIAVNKMIEIFGKVDIVLDPPDVSLWDWLKAMFTGKTEEMVFGVRIDGEADPESWGKHFGSLADELDWGFDDFTGGGGGNPPPYTPPGDKGKDKDKPDYEDPTDAIINRINLRSKELEQQEESIQNAIEIAELENDYKKQISLTNDLIATRKKRIEELNTANAGLHNEAEWLRTDNKFYDKDGNLIDTNTWFNSFGEETEEYKTFYNSQTSKEEQERIKNFFEKISKYKEAYMDNAEEIVGLNKEILQSEKEIVDMLENAFDAIEKAYDLNINRLNSKSTLLSSHYELINAINEEQHNLNKELAEAEIAGAKMNEIERKTLFTKEEHAKLSEKLTSIMNDANNIQSDYLADLETATEDTIEEITNNYERQYELKLKEYEIVKAELNLAKAQQRLENVENEKSVRTWNGTNWVYEANLQDVIDARNEVEDAKYELQRAQTENLQEIALNKLDEEADRLETEKNKLATTLDEISGKTKLSGEELADALKYISENDLPIFEKIIQKVGRHLESLLGDNTYKDRFSGLDASSYATTISKMKANSEKWHTASKSEQEALHKANADYADSIGADYDDATGTWKDKNGNRLYANGTKNAKSGWGMFDENGIGSEYVLTKDGILHNFNMGDKVFNPQMGNNLYEAAQINWKKFSLSDFGGLASVDNSIRNMSNDTYYSVNGVNINSEEGGEIKGFVKFLKAKKI